MGIDASWVKEDLTPIQEVFDPRQCLTGAATSRWPNSETVCLRFVDAFGDTYFNQAQIPTLLKELQQDVRNEFDAEARVHIEKVVRLVERAVGRTHTYIQFKGD